MINYKKGDILIYNDLELYRIKFIDSYHCWAYPIGVKDFISFKLFKLTDSALRLANPTEKLLYG